MEQGETRSLPSGETETNSYLSGETDLAPPGSGEADSIPQPSGETEPAPKASGEIETSPKPSGKAEPPKRRRARQRLALSPQARQSYLEGVGRGGTKLLSFKEGTLQRPYPSRSFYRLVVIGSTFWGTLVLGPRQ